MTSDTVAEGRQPRTLAQRLLREYMAIAYEKREWWDTREGDEADFMARKWSAKIAEIKGVLDHG